MNRAYYSSTIAAFVEADPHAVLGALAEGHAFALEAPQRDSWRDQIALLKKVCKPYSGRGAVYFEFSIPRLGKRIDVVAVIDHVVFVMEFKVGEREFAPHAIDQVCDYALDLKNFHETSHAALMAPVLIATEAPGFVPRVAATSHADGLLAPIRCNAKTLPDVIAAVLAYQTSGPIDVTKWEGGRYSPTPTIVEAAMALYGGHAVAEISRSDAGAEHLARTNDAISRIIEEAKAKSEKAICFVTGVPGAGKTLVGLNAATSHTNKDDALHSVFLSGNGPLVSILREALARDKVRRERERGNRISKKSAGSEVQAFIQNVHHFRDDCLKDLKPPFEHVALFDEAQRAWNREQLASFMKRKRRTPNFAQSEPEFLIACLDRHEDWAVIVCLVGGGQEINTGEAGISEWIDSLMRAYPKWRMYLSSRVTDTEYAAGHALDRVRSRENVVFQDELHLGVSMRSFRAENVSFLVKQLLDLDAAAAKKCLQETIIGRYPVVVTRSVALAKRWLRERARGSERYGLLASSKAYRLKPHAIEVRLKPDPVLWFLNGKDDVRSSYYLEDVATEFEVQGLELDWTGVVWDADLRHTSAGWSHWAFVGNRWNRVQQQDRRSYLKNAYRVLLTRARQGMVIVIPEGDPVDPTRKPEFYDSTFDYLREVGFEVIS